MDLARSPFPLQAVVDRDYPESVGTRIGDPRQVNANVDGTLVRDMYLFEVKNPSESRGPWDYYKQIAVLPGELAFKPLGPNECHMSRSLSN